MKPKTSDAVSPGEGNQDTPGQKAEVGGRGEGGGGGGWGVGLDLGISDAGWKDLRKL